jgi:shikimate kinase
MTKNNSARIFLCGFMGAGKSTIGKALAQKLEEPFYDLDKMIEERVGQSIPQIFKAKGEKAFRQLERQALDRTFSRGNGVIALGGGTLQSPTIVADIKSQGLLVFIETSMPNILQRITENNHRPMLWDENGKMKPKEKLRTDLKVLYEQRLPLYQQAEVIIHSDEFSATDEIINQLQKSMMHNAE